MVPTKGEFNTQDRDDDVEPAASDSRPTLDDFAKMRQRGRDATGSSASALGELLAREDGYLPHERPLRPPPLEPRPFQD
jgi:hypothetical protein